MSNKNEADRLDGIVLIVAEESMDDASTDDEAHQETAKEAFVFRTRGQSEEEPLRLEEISLKPNGSGADDHTDETCEVSSRSSSHGGESHDEEAGHVTQLPDVTAAATAAPQGMSQWIHDLMWLAICFIGIMASFVAYGILLEYATTGDRRLHERTCVVTPTKLDADPCLFTKFTHLVSFLLALVVHSLFSFCNFDIGNRHGVYWKDCQEGNHCRYSRKSIRFARSHASRKHLLCYSILEVRWFIRGKYCCFVTCCRRLLLTF